MLGADSTPDDTGVVECLDVRASKRASCGRCAYALDCSHCPFDCGKLAQARPYGGHQLCGEKRALGYVHVVANFQVLAKVQRLRHDDVTKGLEHHHGDGVARLDVSNDELSEHIKTELDVGKSLDDTDWNCPCRCDDQRKDDRVPGHSGRKCESRSEGKGDHDCQESEIPPSRYEPVLAHDFHVDIIKFSG